MLILTKDNHQPNLTDRWRRSKLINTESRPISLDANLSVNIFCGQVGKLQILNTILYSFESNCRFDCDVPLNSFDFFWLLVFQLLNVSYRGHQMRFCSCCWTRIDAACTLTPTSDIMAESVALLAASQISRLKRAALNNSPRRRRANFTLSPYALRQSRRRHPGSRFQSNLLSVKKKKKGTEGEKRGSRRTAGTISAIGGKDGEGE